MRRQADTVGLGRVVERGRGCGARLHSRWALADRRKGTRLLDLNLLACRL